jgi:soluble lytic murein transglycosylase-like protein
MANRSFAGQLLVLLIGALLVAPAKAVDVTEAAMNRALLGARCPPYFGRGKAVRAATCISNAQRPVLVERAPEILDLFDAKITANLEAARKFDAGKISFAQYTAESKAIAEEFEARVVEWYRKMPQEQCGRILELMGRPSLEPALQAAALEKLRNLGCLR